MRTRKTVRRHTKRSVRSRKPRGANSVVIQITTTHEIVAALDAAVKSGFYGNSRAAAGERLMSEGIRALLKEGTIKRVKALNDL